MGLSGLGPGLGAQSPEPRRSFVLHFTGDLMAHRPNWQFGDYGAAYRSLEGILKTDDLSFINLETPVTAERPWASYPSFNVHPAYLEAAVQAGFEVFALANNHSNDHGSTGIAGTRRTLAAWEARGGVWSNGLRDPGAEPALTLIPLPGGPTLGFFSFTSLANQWPALNEVHYFPYWDLWSGQRNEKSRARVLELVRRFRSQCDLLIVAVHDGHEYVHEPHPHQKDFFRDLADAGADIIWGHHPHVLQPWQWIHRGARSHLLMYSTGNFLSAQTWSLGPGDGERPRAATGDGVLFRVRLARRQGLWTPVQAAPLWLNSLPVPDQGVLVAPTRRWMEEAPEAWRPYFQARWAAQERFRAPRVLGDRRIVP